MYYARSRRIPAAGKGRLAQDHFRITYIEKLLKAEIAKFLNISITGSSASGVDIPELQLNTKATSDRQPQSSEPFNSPYERVLGSKYNIIVCIYNGYEVIRIQEEPLKLISTGYLRKTEVADHGLCQAAQILKRLVVIEGNLDVQLGRRGLRAIVYAKRDYKSPRGRAFKELKSALSSGIDQDIHEALKKNEEAISAEVEAALPTEPEWSEFLKSPLEGKIGISFALQWRYNFSSLAE
jgi:hypothetical protein